MPSEPVERPAARQVHAENAAKSARTEDGPIGSLVSWASDRDVTQRGRALTGVMRRKLRARYAQWHALWVEKSILTRSVSRLSAKHLRQQMLGRFITWRNLTHGLRT